MSGHVEAEGSVPSLCRGSVAEVRESTQGESHENENNPVALLTLL